MSRFEVLELLKLDIKQIALLALLTACNSCIELVIGNIVHLINLPMKGSLLVGLNLMVYAVVRTRVPKFGAITLVGLATALVNFIISGGFKLLALWCIVAEALAVDVLLSLFGLGVWSLMVAGVTAGLLSVACGMVNAVIFMDREAAGSFVKLAGVSGLNLSFNSLILFVVVTRIFVGCLFGFVTYRALELLQPASLSPENLPSATPVPATPVPASPASASSSSAPATPASAPPVAKD